MRFLIADDEVISRATLERTLRGWGHSVVSVADGAAAWDALRAEDSPRLAVLDWVMPGLEGPEESDTTSAIIIGYGRFGQAVAQMLMARGVSVTLIDSKPSQIEISGDFGMKVYYGDGTRIDLLRNAGAEDAEALLFCIDGDNLTAKKLEPILEAFPQAAVFVRAFDRRHVMRLDGVDLAGVYREVFESAVCMGREALVSLGVPEPEVAQVEEEYRRRDSERLINQAKSGDLHARKDMMFRPGESIADDAATGASG
jgi:CPA2 family monovalent cation:H+ antiporter-2